MIAADQPYRDGTEGAMEEFRVNHMRIRIEELIGSLLFSYILIWLLWTFWPYIS